MGPSWTVPDPLLLAGLVVFALQAAAIVALLVERRLRRRAESARKRADAEVQRTLHELAHMNMRAGMGEIVSAVTHEVNQPLTASLGNAQALKRMLATGLVQEDLVSILDDIIDANRRAADVMGRIRTLMRKEAFDLHPIDVNSIVTDVVRVLTPAASNEGILLVADLDPDLPRLPGDEVQLRQVVMNLVLNAVQATRSQPGVPPLVRVATGTQRGRVVLIVEDAGAGIGEDALPHLFEPYFTTKQEGLGVGLSISRSIVESHGGWIDVANLAKGGARFSVTLPVTV
jgi:C4-dicarboxylate-specific signal transduction histidine kinase